MLGDLIMVKVISISDDVYAELSTRKNGKSFTEIIKTLLAECPRKGDPKTILEFLKTHDPIDEESAKNILKASEEGRKRSMPRKFASLE